MKTQSENRPAQYSRQQVILHWAIAVLVLVQFTVNDAMRLAFRQQMTDPQLFPALGALAHIIVGITVLALTLIRIRLKMTQGVPKPPLGGPKIFEWIGKFAHLGLYFLLLYTAITGLTAWLWVSFIAAKAHEIGRFALIALILAHIIGALIEHFIFGNKVIRRMLKL